MTPPAIPCQRQLFDIPRDVAYLNCAYMSPLSHAVIAAVDRGARMKATPWRLTIPDFYDAVDQARALAAGPGDAHTDKTRDQVAGGEGEERGGIGHDDPRRGEGRRPHEGKGQAHEKRANVHDLSRGVAVRHG